MSVDYTVPRDAVRLRVDAGRTIRILPLALMRRKNIIKFDFRDHDGRPMPLLGLRENQALTLAVVRAWADATLDPSEREWPQLPGDLGDLLDDVVAGDQAELDKAYRELERRKQDERVSPYLMAVLERLAGNFVLFASESATPGTRRIVKWSYDEPLTLLHSTTGYQGYAEGPCPGHPNGDEQRDLPNYGKVGADKQWWKPDPLRASLGLQPTLIRFPTPGAELAASFHVEITAPPEVSIVQASMLAGTPNLRFADSPQTDRERWKVYEREHEAARSRRGRARRRPSFDSVGGGYPTVDLHVAEVPYGSLSRAQVELQASPSGWLGSAWLVTLLATATLMVAWWADPSGADSAELPTAVLISFAAAMVAIVLRPDPHVMVTRLLSRLRMLAAASAVLVLAGGCAFAFRGSGDAHPWIEVIALLSVIPASVLTRVWWLARGRLVRDRPPGRRAAERRRRRARVGSLAEEYAETVEQDDRSRMLEARRKAKLIRLSPWEQNAPGQEHDPYVDTSFHVELAQMLDAADFPYDEAIVQLGFDRPGIKVASIEGDRSAFHWTLEFQEQFWRRIDAEIGETAQA